MPGFPLKIDLPPKKWAIFQVYSLTDEIGHTIKEFPQSWREIL
jgi:hypothetical protein